MLRIKLKPKSPEYADGTTSDDQCVCDIYGCNEAGEYKAPKTRGLNDYFMFCLDHIREYNKGWNFFEGMAAHEVREHMLRSMYGDRPTWRNDLGPDIEEVLQRRIWQTYNNSEADPFQKRAQQGGSFNAFHHDTPEFKAMAVMGVEPPLNLEVLKKRYKELARKYHPDHNKGSSESEELLKDVNIAYTILKDAFEKYEKLEKDG
jgi:hypothetical protein